MPTTKTVTLYKYEELSPKAQEKALETHQRLNVEFAWEYDWQQSLEKCLQHFDLRINHRESLEFLNDALEHLKGIRLWKFINACYTIPEESCPFTGYCGDDSFLHPVRKFLLRPDTDTTGYELFRDCLYSWQQDVEGDHEYQLSEDNLKELDYDFLESGQLF